MTKDLATLEKEVGIPLPADTRVLWVERQSGMDDMVRTKLQMSRRAFATLADKLPVKPKDLRPGAGRLGTDREGWDPHATPGLRSGQAALDDGRYLNVGVADDGATVTVFLMNHGT
jgi:hypothetical protein